MRKYLYTSVVCLTMATCIPYATYAEKAGMVRLNKERFYAKTITGTVTSDAGEPLIGASVSLKGTTTGAVTDINGSFSITVPDEGGVLVVTYIGFLQQEVPINDRTTVNIVLQTDAKALEEVVVIGYGVQKKSVVTGAISSVRATDLENQQITRVEQAIQGRTSGVTVASNSGAPGAASTVRVRGITTLNSNEPLYVVDGVVVSGGIDYLNQSDIESIELLKDAASAAIYGTRGAAGVILVTTKKGRQGSVRINYNAYIGTQAPVRKLDLLNATQYATLRNEAYSAGWQPGQPFALPYPDPQALGEGTDWQSTVFNDNALIQNHDFALSGGNDKSTFYASYGYLNQEGIVTTAISSFERHNVRLNSTHKATKWLTIGQTLGYSHIKSKGGLNPNTEFGGPLSSAINLDPTTPVIITDPEILNNPESVYNRQPVVRNAQGFPYGISNTVQQEMTNPLAYVQTQLGNYGWSDNIVGNAFVEVEPVTGLRVRSSLGGKLAYWGGESFRPIYYLNASTVSPQTARSRDRNMVLDYNIENTISYARAINGHNFSVMLGQGAYKDGEVDGLGVSYNAIPATNFGDASFNLQVPTANITAYGYDNIAHTISSLFSRVTYDYKEKYLLTGIIRRDGSSRFGDNNKYGYFPSISLGWVASNETFWPTNPVVDFLKVRGSYGVVGNDNTGNFAFVSTVGAGRNYTFGNEGYTIGYSPNAPANPDLRWEETAQTNIGFETTLFNAINLTIDWYNKKTSGILRPLEIPGYVGSTGFPVANIADMQNRGIELELGYNRQVGDFSFGLTGNASYVKNKILSLEGGKEFTEDGAASIHTFNGRLNRMIVDHPYGTFYGYKTNGIFQTVEDVASYVNSAGQVIQPNARPGDFRWVDLNDDGVIDADDRMVLGKPLPDWTFGVTFNAAWKNFDLMVFGQGVTGNQIFQGLRRLDVANANWQTRALGRWTGEGTSNDYPRLSTSDPNNNFSNPSDFYLEDGDYFRIKTFQIGYTLPSVLTDKISLQKARFYVSANNLLTFTNYTGYDPEIGGNIMGVDRAFYPQARTLMAGINIGF
ncbi:SusC/RagA family TonB-linked outer membrane protein [Pontibacter virosus]|uniref:TonB-linked SusC/RagA family outer membrane protein n=1 Tax=Pontibacter virosus TaxID=1765052 RepID=A0A2U1AZ59_9BACT|nr:TonB-dependent receptor [Pontibacter virosus]PVY41708.1 TonB-linked SusC/RagA family outer membrane protein [Pontibacter virosus]